MGEKVPIKIDAARGLRFIGTVYKGPADAAKEPIPNFIDEHINPNNASRAKELGICRVVYTLTPSKIVIEGSYGMNKERFKYVLNSVLRSDKEQVDYVQIGRQAAGLFSWFQIPAKKCVYYSKAMKGDPTVKVTIREGQGDAEIETATKQESLKEPGMRFEISMLEADPTKASSALHPLKFSKFLGKIFRDYLKEGILEIEIRCKGESSFVKPAEIELPCLTFNWAPIRVKGDHLRIIKLELYYDSSGQGVVSIRHTRIPNVDNLRELGDVGMGLEYSIYASAYITGNIDADFLKPVAGKKGFEQNRDWYDFLAELEKIRPAIEAEVNLIKKDETEKKLLKVQAKAFELAREILSQDYFAELQLLEGARKLPEPALPPNGFDFVPSSVRIDPGKRGVIAFKTYVGGNIAFVPDKGLVFFKIDNPGIEISPKRITLKESEADEDGVVTVKVELYSKKAAFGTLSAVHGGLEAEASVNFAGKKERAGRTEGIGGSSINYEETKFLEEPQRHSRLEGNKTIRINTLCPDYLRAVSGSEKEMTGYLALLIAKETLVSNNRASDECLEKMLTFHFQMDGMLGRGKKKKDFLVGETGQESQ